ncbi:hypothetical protein Ahy_A05g025664 [Arachis hypogaea]|uniref:Uncharacterized protein n=1 Tax=Arachis hypogaea TaxID=3818 RepID=A0A445D976_ARAHY|nr:hypothetical protein Ahy_A05g025664 [Arachis hypogaea]
MEERRGKNHFRFQERWYENKDVINLIKRSWKVDIQGSPMYKLIEKLKHCRCKTVEWKKTSSSKSQTNIQHLKDQIIQESNKGFEVNESSIRIWEAELEEALERKIESAVA